MLDQDGDGKSDAGVGLVRYLATAADQIFDFSSTPLVPFGFTYDPGTSGRPVITWMNSDPRSTAQMLTISYRTNTPQRVAFYHHMTVPATSAGLVYPELPDQLAAFRPAQYDELSLQTLKFDTSKSYSDYLNAIVSQKGRFYDAAGFNSYSYASISRVP